MADSYSSEHISYYGARYYDPALGRFVSADSIVPGNGSGKRRLTMRKGPDSVQ